MAHSTRTHFLGPLWIYYALICEPLSITDFQLEGFGQKFNRIIYYALLSFERPST